MIKKLLLIGLLCSISKLDVYAQRVIRQQKTFGGSNYDGGSNYRSNTILPTSDKGFIIASTSDSNNGDLTSNKGDNDLWIIKLDSTLNIKWQKSIGGSKVDTYGPVTIIPTSDKGFVIGTSSFSNDGDLTGIGAHGGTDFWIIKLDADGNIQWQKLYGGSKEDFLYSIISTRDGGFIAMGHTQSSDGDVVGYHDNMDIWVIKLNADGNIQWKKTLGGKESDHIPYSGAGGMESRQIIIENESKEYILGFTSSSNDGDISSRNHGGTDICITKLDASGNIVWLKMYGGSKSDSFTGIVNMSELNPATSREAYGIYGMTNSDDGDIDTHYGGIDAWVARIEGSSGSILWKKTLGGTLSDGFELGVEDTWDTKVNNGIILTGATLSPSVDAKGISDCWIVKIDIDGNVVWEKRYGGSRRSTGYQIKPIEDRGYLIAGITNGKGKDVSWYHEGYEIIIRDTVYTDDIWMIKLNSLGNIEWQRALGGTKNEFGPSAIQLTSDNNYIITAGTYSNNGDVTANHGISDLWVVKFGNPVPIIKWPDGFFTAYPTIHVTDKIQLEIEKELINAEGIISNLMGEEKIHFSMNEKTKTLDVSTLTSGMYIITLYKADGSKQQIRFIK